MINIVDAFFYVVNGCLEVVVRCPLTECVLHIRWVANAAIIVLDDGKLINNCPGVGEQQASWIHYYTMPTESLLWAA